MVKFGACMWDCGEFFYVGGVKVSCEVGSAFPIGEYEDR
jgi:hypothetical protein